MVGRDLAGSPGKDGYLRAYSATGTVLSTTQFGSVADDSVAGIVVNGTGVLVAGQDGTAGVEGLNDDVGVEGGWDDDDHRIDFRIAQQFIVVRVNARLGDELGELGLGGGRWVRSGDDSTARNLGE